MYLEIQEIQYAIIMSSSILLSGLFLSYFNRFSNTEKKFGYFILTGSFFEYFGWGCYHLFNLKNNLFGLHLFTLFEFIILGHFLIEILNTFQIKLPTKKILIVGSILIILNSIFLQELNTINSNSIAGVKVFIIAFSIYIFYNILVIKNYNLKEIRPSVFFITAVFLNASTSIIWYLFGNEILTMSDENWNKLDILKYTSTIIASFTILVGLYYAIIRNENDLI